MCEFVILIQILIVSDVTESKHRYPNVQDMAGLDDIYYGV